MKNLLKKILPSFLLDFYYFLWPLLGALFYGFPSKNLKVIGVTGTNGKTTVVELCSKILEEAGYKVASLSSIKFKIGKKEWKNTLKMTMPGRFKLQQFLNQAKKAGCQYVVLEVTSEGIKQQRHRLINFEVAVFTNLSPEHLEAHGSFEKYRQTKGKLFAKTKKIHIINADDPNANYFLKFPANKKITYSLKKESIMLQGMKLLGQFNIYNALAAIKVGLSQGIDLETCQRAIKKVEGIPGRLEKVISEPFQVWVDYAHTPDALEKVYQIFQQKRLICVLGACGGGRDKWKRPKLGKIAQKYCQKIILTNEDPYQEDPLKILEEIEKGISSSNYQKILDRRLAISRALNLANPGDLVIITGKGCEPWLCIGTKKIPWDDREVVKEEFEKLKEAKYESLGGS